MATTQSPDAPLQDANANDAGFSARIRSAVFWRSGSQIVAQLVSWTSTLLVMRLLDPADYGLFSMTQVILNFMGFLNGYGLISALVQSESLSRKQLRQAFGLVLLLNGALALIQLAVMAPLASAYYHQPMVADLLRVQAIIYLSIPFISVPEVIMGRSLDFRAPAVVSLASALVAGLVAIVGALSGWGVWTLVFAPIAGFGVKGIGNMIATRLLEWPSFDFRGLGPTIRFGLSLLAVQFFFLIESQSGVFIGGHSLDPHELGLYTEALFLTQIFVSKFIPPLNEVAFPAFARMQKDVDKVKRSFCTAVRLLLLVSCPLYFGMAITAEPLIVTLLGPKWIGSAPYVSILALAMPFMTVQVMFGPVSNALGQPGLTARISAMGALIMPTAFLIGIGHGAIGLAWAWLLAYPVYTAITAWLAGRNIGLTWIELARAVAPGVGASALMALVVLGVDRMLPSMPSQVQLALLVATGAIAYSAILLIFARGTVEELRGLLLRKPAAG